MQNRALYECHWGHSLAVAQFCRCKASSSWYSSWHKRLKKKINKASQSCFTISGWVSRTTDFEKCVFVGSEVWGGMRIFIAERNREGSWETEVVIPQWIKQSDFYTQELLEGWTIKRENLVSYNRILSNINRLKASGTQTFPLLHQMWLPPHPKETDFKIGNVHDQSE